MHSNVAVVVVVAVEKSAQGQQIRDSNAAVGCTRGLGQLELLLVWEEQLLRIFLRTAECNAARYECSGGGRIGEIYS